MSSYKTLGRVLLCNTTWLSNLFTLLHSSHLHTPTNSAIKNQVHKNLLNNIFQSKCHHRYSQQETSSVVRWHSNDILWLNTNVRDSKKWRFLLQHWSSPIYQSFLKVQIIKPPFFFTLKRAMTTVKKTGTVIIICNIQLPSLISSFPQDKETNRKDKESAKPTKNSNQFISRFGFDSNNSVQIFLL